MSQLLEPLTGVRTGCLCCPPKPDKAPMDWDPDPGFGIVKFKCDGETRESYMHHDSDTEADFKTFQDFEDVAAGDPDHDWRLEIHGPMGGVTYQRHGEAEWYPVERFDGFA